MIKSIGIENLRVFKDYTEFELAPITLLTGPNNSGKSSFLKLMNLIQHSFGNNNSTNMLLFNSGTHNLGTFENAIHWGKESEIIKIVLDFPLDYFDEIFKLELTYKKFKENAILNSFKIFNNSRVLFQLTDLYMDYYGVSDIDFTFSIDLKYLKRTVNIDNGWKEFLNYSERIKLSYLDYLSGFQNLNSTFEKITDNYRVLMKNGSSIENIPMPNDLYVKIHFPEEYERVASKPFQFFEYKLDSGKLDHHDQLIIDENESFERELSSCNFGFKTKGSDLFTDIFFEEGFAEFELPRYVSTTLNNYRHITVSQENVDNFNKYFVKNINLALQKIKFSFDCFQHISAVRGGKNRLLSNISTNDIDEIVKDFTQLDLLEDSATEQDGKLVYSPNRNKTFLTKALALLNIQGEVIIERLGGVASLIYIKSGNNKVSLADLGYGYSQMIPILLKIIMEHHYSELNAQWHVNPYYIDIPFESENEQPILINEAARTLVIEEPESNLHPNLQSKLADVVVLAYATYGIRFILETHSEYLVRKLQFLTASNEISTDHVNIYYFNANEYVTEKQKKVKKININEFGGLTDSFGPGFFDEATQLQFELLKLNKGQSN